MHQLIGRFSVSISIKMSYLEQFILNAQAEELCGGCGAVDYVCGSRARFRVPARQYEHCE